MPNIYLSPSVQEYNPFIIGGSEEHYMNRIADAMVPYLRASGIDFARNNPGSTLSQVTAQSNAEEYGLHLALHSNTSPENMRGILQGPDIYYYTTSVKGGKAASMIADYFEEIYPDPSLVAVIPTTIMAELRKTKAPAVLVQVAYHDNYADATWIRDNIDLIAEILVKAAAEYLEVPFVTPQIQT